MDKFKQIEKNKEKFKEIATSQKHLTSRQWYESGLNIVKERINFLEGIYRLGGLDFSEEFKDSAYRERQMLCMESSALYSLIDKIEDN